MFHLLRRNFGVAVRLGPPSQRAPGPAQFFPDCCVGCRVPWGGRVGAGVFSFVLSSHAHTRTHACPQISFVFCGCRFSVCVVSFVSSVCLSVRPVGVCVCVCACVCVCCLLRVVLCDCCRARVYRRVGLCTGCVHTARDRWADVAKRVLLRSAGVGPAT